MELNGWSSPQMLRHYGASARSARARCTYDRIVEPRPLQILGLADELPKRDDDGLAPESLWLAERDVEPECGIGCQPAFGLDHNN